MIARAATMAVPVQRKRSIWFAFDPGCRTVAERNPPTGQADERANALELPFTHLAVGIIVTAVWGTNFVVIRQGLAAFPPFLFGALRFMFVFFPAALFVRRPAVRWSRLATYGLASGGGQFGLLYIAMNGHISAGLASLVIQSQVFFTVAIAIASRRERAQFKHGVAAILALLGLTLIGLRAGGDSSSLGLFLVLGAALSWAVANTVMRHAPSGTMFGFIIWPSPFAVVPLLLLSAAFEGRAEIFKAVVSAPLWAWLAVLWQSSANTLFGFAIWGWLLQRHRAATVTPLALLVPVFGIGSAALILGEPVQSWKLLAALLVLSALAINLISIRARSASAPGV